MVMAGEVAEKAFSTIFRATTVSLMVTTLELKPGPMMITAPASASWLTPSMRAIFASGSPSRESRRMRSSFLPFTPPRALISWIATFAGVLKMFVVGVGPLSGTSRPM